MKNNYNYIHLIKTEDEYKYENFVYKKIENQNKVLDLQVIYGNIYSIVILFNNGDINFYDFCTMNLQPKQIQNVYQLNFKNLVKLVFLDFENDNLNLLLKNDDNYSIFNLENNTIYEIKENEENKFQIEGNNFTKYGKHIYDIKEGNIRIFQIEKQ